MVKKHELDFTVGPILKKMILYALPIIGVNVLQLLFTAADLAVLGYFTNNDQAIAAIGATTHIVNIMLAFFTGLSIGANVLIARCVGARDTEKARKLVGTAVFCAVVSGIVIMIVGVVLSEQVLLWTNCPDTVLPYATTYLRIYFLGAPIIMVYNFCAAILRAVGDTFRPFLFLIIGGILNIILNIFFVLVVGWDIEGVAIATLASKTISGISTLVIMFKSDGYARLEKKYFKFYKEEFSEILVIGLPLAISKCLFSFANILVQTELNLLGDIAMTAHSITKEFDGFMLEAVHGVGTSTLAIVSQNYGAKKFDRITKVLFVSLFLNFVICLVLSVVLLLFGRTFCSLMSKTEEVLDLCVMRIQTVSIFYIILGVLSVLQEAIRGIGYSFTSLLISVFANIVLRFIYIFFILPAVKIANNVAHNLKMLYVMYPTSWAVASVVALVIFVILFRKEKNKNQLEKQSAEQDVMPEK
jgi:putative MATE family efflux protein